MTAQDISQELNKKVLIITMAISVAFVILRSVARWVKRHKFPYASEDIAMYVALAAFIIQCALYIAAMPTLYNVLAVEAGLMAPYPSLSTDLVAMLKEFLSVLIFFWLTLWAVKCSMLLMFRRLTVGLPFYERLWTCVMGFVILTYIGAVISNFTSCHSMHAWFTAGECLTPADTRAKAISLWYALAVDVLTDILIMAIPIKLLWNLKISTREKIAVGVVFTVGIITMIFAIVRTLSLDKTTSGGQVSTQWLILWGAIEGMVSIIVGCLPAFAIFIRGRVVKSKATYGTYPTPNTSNRYQSNSNGETERQKSRVRAESLQLHDMGLEMGSVGGDSKKSLVEGVSDGNIRIERAWSQRWHTSNELDREQERESRMGLRIGSPV